MPRWCTNTPALEQIIRKKSVFGHVINIRFHSNPYEWRQNVTKNMGRGEGTAKSHTIAGQENCLNHLNNALHNYQFIPSRVSLANGDIASHWAAQLTAFYKLSLKTDVMFMMTLPHENAFRTTVLCEDNLPSIGAFLRKTSNGELWFFSVIAAWTNY